MRKMIMVVVVATMFAGTTQAGRNRSYSLRDIVRAAGDTQEIIQAQRQNEQDLEIKRQTAERVNRALDGAERTAAPSANVPYYELPNTAQGQRIAQIRTEQSQSENAQLRQALIASVQTTSQLQAENAKLRATISDLQKQVAEIRAMIQAQQSPSQ